MAYVLGENVISYYFWRDVRCGCGSVSRLWAEEQQVNLLAKITEMLLRILSRYFVTLRTFIM